MTVKNRFCVNSFSFNSYVACKKIRNDKGFWQQRESYCLEHSIAEFSHGLCPQCEATLYPELVKQRNLATGGGQSGAPV